MGLYVCEANNGIPPSAKEHFQVEVHCKINYIDPLQHSALSVLLHIFKHIIRPYVRTHF